MGLRYSRRMTTILHAEGAAAWDIQPGVLALIAAQVRPGMTTLETGAGQSTLAFVRAGARHHAVTPSQDEAARIRAALSSEGLSDAGLTFHHGYSQDVLPRLEAGPLDVALIDGGHGFPIPALDLAYIAPRLKPGGWLMIDDVDLWTGAMLVDFLKAEPAFTLEAIERGRTAMFRCRAPFALREWTNQPAVVAKSRFSQWRRKAANGLALALSGRFGALAGKLAHERDLKAAAKADY
jgi:predicted O-methyltransferase YrrM